VDRFHHRLPRRPANDTFKWSPKIKMEAPADHPKELIVDWDSQRDFSGDAQARA